jgi:hypothetical protein
MVIDLVNFAVLWLNAFHCSSGVSKIFSPRTIMNGTSLDDANHCKLPFNAYVEAHEENLPYNTMNERTQCTICMGPTSNFKGSYKFMCLKTGQQITRKQFLEILLPADVIKRVEAITLRNNQSGELLFTGRQCNIVGDEPSGDDP